MSDSEFAKTHLTDHLRSLIVPPVAEGFWSIHKSSKELCERNNQNDQILRTFQNMLTKIPEWSDSTLTTEVERIEKTTKCNYLDDLIMGVYISYMKSFASLHYRDSSKEIEIDFDRPSLSKFVHELYIHSARKLWQTAYLLNTEVPAETHARNRQEIEKVIGQCLDQVIRGFLPWHNITKKYFGNSGTSVSQPEPEPEAELKTEEVVPDKKVVEFESDDSESEDEEPPKLNITDEDTVLDIAAIDLETTVSMDDLEKKITDTLVLNL